MSARSGVSQVIEASAPCSLRLADGVGLALDRRVSCRLELGGLEGVEIEVKDARLEVQAERVSELPSDGVAGWLAGLLAAAGLERSVRLVTHARVPAGTGLGVRAAVAVSVAGAVLAATQAAGAQQVAAWLRLASPELAPADVWTSLLGGAVALGPAGAEQTGERLPVDPARLEEGLLLVETGLSGQASVATSSWSPGTPTAAVAEALRERSASRVPATLMRSPAPEVLASEPRLADMVARAQGLGAAAWLCGEGFWGLLALWGGPDERRELLERARRAGLRPVACRLDLLGLEVEVLATGDVRG